MTPRKGFKGKKSAPSTREGSFAHRKGAKKSTRPNPLSKRSAGPVARAARRPTGGPHKNEGSPHINKRSAGEGGGQRDSGQTGFYERASRAPRHKEARKPTRPKPSVKRSPYRSGRSAAQQGGAAEKDKGPIRLNKYIANSGAGSRRQADEMIRRGLISVNNEVITTMGYKVSPGDTVRYEDRVLKAEKPVYVLLNKPKGFITTTDDPQERKTVMSLVAQAAKERLYPVGRLDRSTTGLLVLTNDGALANRLAHPSYRTKKVYKVILNRPLTRNDGQKILDGVWLEEGKAVIDDLAVLTADKKTIGLELHIGWNRIIHRMFGALGYEVIRLDRTFYAGLSKKDLPRGRWRFLAPKEVAQLKKP